MHGRPCFKQAARTLHIRKSNSIYFPFPSGRGEAAAVHARAKRYGGCAPSALPRQGPPEARPTPHLEASSPRPVLLFPFNTQNRDVQDVAATIGRPADSSKQGRPIHPNSRYVQICKNLILSTVDNQLLLRHQNYTIEPTRSVTRSNSVLRQYCCSYCISRSDPN